MKQHPWCDRTLMACSLYYTLCLDEAAFKRVLKHMHVAPEHTPPFVSNGHSNATTHHFEDKEECKKSAVICMRWWEGLDPISVAGLLVHEAVHVWQEHCRDIGEHVTGTEEEAYAIQNISQCLMASFREQTK